MQTAVIPQKSVHVIPAQVNIQDEIKSAYRQLRVAAYCRVSTKQDEQLNSYEVQRTHYEERIRTEPKWSLVGIFADKGITGTNMKKRDEFNKMLRLCYKGKIDMIIVKSISRFARNTLDVIKITISYRAFLLHQQIHVQLFCFALNKYLYPIANVLCLLLVLCNLPRYVGLQLSA